MKIPLASQDICQKSLWHHVYNDQHFLKYQIGNFHYEEISTIIQIYKEGGAIQKYGCYPKEIEPNIHFFSLGLTTTLTLFFRTILEDIGMKFPIYIQKQNLLNR